MKMAMFLAALTVPPFRVLPRGSLLSKMVVSASAPQFGEGHPRGVPSMTKRAN